MPINTKNGTTIKTIYSKNGTQIKTVICGGKTVYVSNLPPSLVFNGVSKTNVKPGETFYVSFYAEINSESKSNFLTVTARCGGYANSVTSSGREIRGQIALTAPYTSASYGSAYPLYLDAKDGDGNSASIYCVDIVVTSS